MTRRKRYVKENHERWLVSYADLVTLLFAFFVVMFASAQTDHSRAKEISQAVQKALKSGSTPPKIAAILGGTVDDAGRGNALLRGPALRSPEPPQPKAPSAKTALAPTALPKKALPEVATPQPPLPETTRQALDPVVALLRGRLAKELAKGDVELHVEERGVIIGLNSAVFFSLGGASIDPRVYPTLKEVADILNRLPNRLRLEGHTDSLPISNARFESNWELSAARSIAMLRLLNERYQVRRERMEIVGYADTLAIDSNDTPAGRGRNRRVDIVIVSDAGLRAERRAP